MAKSRRVAEPRLAVAIRPNWATKPVAMLAECRATQHSALENLPSVARPHLPVQTRASTCAIGRLGHGPRRFMAPDLDGLEVWPSRQTPMVARWGEVSQALACAARMEISHVGRGAA
jgi:hypothetical protein